MRYTFQSLTDVIDLGNESPWCRVGGRDPVFERIERGLGPVDDTELWKIFVRWRATMRSLMSSSSPMCRFDFPSATSTSTSNSRWGEPVGRFRPGLLCGQTL
jgi:hypothetical protein